MSHAQAWAASSSLLQAGAVSSIVGITEVVREAYSFTVTDQLTPVNEDAFTKDFSKGS